MRYLKQFLIVLSAVIFLSTIVLVSDANAQRRTVRVSSGYTYPVVTRRVYISRPFYYSRFYDPFYDPYFYDPYLSAQRDKYYKEKSVRDARRKLAKNREKYSADGVLTAKEREKLIDNEESLAKATRKLREFNAQY